MPEITEVEMPKIAEPEMLLNEWIHEMSEICKWILEMNKYMKLKEISEWWD